MAILYPLVIPLTVSLAPDKDAILLGTIGAILSGSVFGDHCSPISDTCIMSSMATACDHTDHVKTQLVYALVVAFVSLVFGWIPVGMGWYPPVRPTAILLHTEFQPHSSWGCFLALLC